jgi:hypothetical protein
MPRHHAIKQQVLVSGELHSRVAISMGQAGRMSEGWVRLSRYGCDGKEKNHCSYLKSKLNPCRPSSITLVTEILKFSSSSNNSNSNVNLSEK